MANECMLVVGVRSEHANMLREMYKNIDFSFITDQRKQTKPVNDISHFDRIINMTKFSWIKHFFRINTIMN